MKKLLQTFVVLLLCQITFAQTAAPSKVNRATVSKSVSHALHQAAGSTHGTANASSRANRNVLVDYASVEDSLGTLALDSVQYYPWYINKQFTQTAANNYNLKWAYQAFDSIVDYPSLNRLAFPTASYQLDSLAVPFRHINTTGTNDTIKVVVYSRTAHTAPTTDVNGNITNTILYKDSFILNASAGTPNNVFYNLMLRPNLTLAAGQHFGVAVYFSGNVNNTFEVLSALRKSCTTCVANESTFGENAFFNLIYINGSTNIGGAQGNLSSLYFDCNSNTTYEPALCEAFYIQEFDISAYMSIPVPAIAPVADFVANQTTLTAGGSVNFTDLSTNTPTSWAWTFTGGTPSTSTAQNPAGVVYSTPGTYNVSLTATNATGSNTKTKTGYIVVTAAGSNTYTLCDTFLNLLATDSLKIYSTTGGYLAGHNGFGDKGKAEFFVNPTPGAPINTAFLLFGRAKASNTTNTFTVNLWDATGTGGAPGTILASKTVKYSDAAADVAAGNFTVVPFATNPAPAGNFYIGITYNYVAGDTIALVTNKINQHATNSGWELQSGTAGWFPYSDATNSYGVNLSHYIAFAQCATITCPTITATFTPVNATCTSANGSITAAGAGGTAPYTYKWGTTPIQTTATISNLAAGTYTVTVTDSHGCSGTSTGTVGTTNVTITPNITTNPAVCTAINGSATAAPTGGTTPYTYHWSNNASTAGITNVAAGTYTVTITSANGCTVVGTATVASSSGTLAATVTTTNAVCTSANGTATVAPTGGTTPYIYSWSVTPAQTTATATNLVAGTFVVTVSDANGCSVIKTATVGSSNGNLTATATSTQSTCGQSNGSVTAVPAGGTAPYAYTWSGGQTSATVSSLAAGSYTVTVRDANGCSATASATVTSPSSPVPTLTIVNVACFGGSTGSASVAVTGGVTPFQYNWSPSGSGTSLTGLAAGPVSVTVTDANGCTGNTTGTVTQPASALSLTISSSTNPACSGATSGSITALASGGSSGYTFTWSTNPAQTNATATNLAAGTYTVTVRDANGCSTTATTTLTNPVNGVAVTVANGSTTACGVANGSLTAVATSGVTPYSYTWSTTPVQTGATASGLAGGTYRVTVTDGGGCTASASATVVEPGAQTATATTTPTNCFGSTDGAVTLAVSGGSGNYTYTWSSSVSNTNSATGLTAGTYNITVHDNSSNCNAFVAATVNSPAQLVITVNTVDVTCFGGTNGTASASVTGGTSGYTYQWLTTPAQTTNAISGLAAGNYILNVTDAHSCQASKTVTISQPTQIVGSISKTDVTCNGANNGVALASAQGGNGPYNFAWSTSPAQNGATAGNLAPGSYTVTITDAHNCTVTQSTTISQPNAVVATISSSTNAGCNGTSNGSATVGASGGTGAFTYSWSTNPVQTTATASNLAAGTYSVTVKDANNCSATASVTITTPTSLTLTVNATNAGCNGTANGSATAVVTGGTPNYAYSWSTTPTQSGATATNLAVGSYTVTVTDANGCSVTGSANITQPTVINAVSTITNAGCQGDSTGRITLAVTGGTPTYTYAWSNGTTSQNLTGVPSGSYSVTVTDNGGCSTTLSNLNVSDGGSLNITTSSTNETSAGVGGTATASVTGAVGTVSYHWSNGANGSTLANLSAGSYGVTATDANGCSIAGSTTVGSYTGINTVSTTATLGLYPNPTTGNVTIDLQLSTTADVTVEWFNMLGERMVSEQFINASTINRAYNFSDNAAGVYVAKITYNGESLTRKVIVNH